MKSRSEKILKINLSIGKYLLWASPAAIGTVVVALSKYGSGGNATTGSGLLWDIFGWHMMFWFVCGLYFLFALLLSTSLREVVLSRVTKSEERDERESLISGRASKSTFLLTLATLIVLLFFSGLKVSFYKPSPEERLNGTKGHISLGYTADFFKVKEMKTEDNKGISVNYSGLPFTTETILFLLILVHVSGYHLFRRRDQV